ncbi:MAG: thiamine pyrophosphate-binding protein [Chloroflexi bacterium]|nr:thiamine pyrophosphate-binding protein [Chloroflexota bacterium]
MQTTESAPAATRRLTPSQAVVASLQAHGVDLFFGLDGDHVVPIFNALADAPAIRPITVKHENTASIAAEVYGRLTGRPGVVLVTAGPGALNSLPGVAGAYAAGAPVVHISGGVANDAAREAFHGVDGVDFVQRAFEPVTKWSTRVGAAADIPAALTRAFALATSGRPGPVHVEIPFSTLQAEPATTIMPAAVDAAPAVPAVSPAVAARLDQADQIAIVVGKGAGWPVVTAALVALAERLQAPVAHTWDAHAAMPTVHPLSIGVWRGGATGSHPAAARAVDEADLVLGIGLRRGTEAERALTDSLGDRLLRLDTADDAATPIGYEAASVAALAGWLMALAQTGRARPANPEVLARCAEAQRLLASGLEIELARHASARSWHIGQALAALGRRMTPDTIVISDVSNVKLWAPLQLPTFGPASHLQSGSWGAMGYALPGVLAAGLARPGQKVVGLTGDTSFLMASSDFVTLCELKLPVVMAVHADGQIGMINNAMTMQFGRAYATDIGRVDFVQYAEACGAQGIRVDDPADLDRAWDAALTADGPVLLELRAGHDFPRPWPVNRLIEQAAAGGLN